MYYVFHSEESLSIHRSKISVSQILMRTQHFFIRKIKNETLRDKNLMKVTFLFLDYKNKF